MNVLLICNDAPYLAKNTDRNWLNDACSWLEVYLKTAWFLCSLSCYFYFCRSPIKPVEPSLTFYDCSVPESDSMSRSSVKELWYGFIESPKVIVTHGYSTEGKDLISQPPAN